MKFKRILAVVLSALMLSSMASFTVSAQDAELLAEPVWERLAISGNVTAKPLYQTEYGTNSQQYDAENDIVYARHVPNFDQDGAFYPNMYSISIDVESCNEFYFVAYIRSNIEGTPSCRSYKTTLKDGTTKDTRPVVVPGEYVGDGEWVKQIYEFTGTDVTDTKTVTHFIWQPVGSNKNNTLPEDAYVDVAYAAVLADKASAEAYNPLANCSGKITISFDANGGEGEFDSYDVAAGKYVASNVVFPTEAPVAPEGMEFNGWAAEETGTPITGDVATPDVSTTYYAQYKYADEEGVEYDDIYLQNVYYKLINEKNLTIGYLGGSVTVGSGAENPGPNSTVAWRALTTQWFKDNFADATIKEVYAGIGGTGSRFGSYRMTRDLDLANNKIDLLFVDSCVNDSYEGFNYDHKEDLQGNDAVIVAKILENNPKCEIVFVNVPNDGTIKSAADSGAVQAHREFADANGFAFVDFKIAMARALTGDSEATHSEDISEWNKYYADSVHPLAEGYKVYFDYLNEVLLSDLVNEELNVSKATYEDTVPTELDLDTVDTNRFVSGAANSNTASGLNTIKNYLTGQNNGFMGGARISAAMEGYSTTFKFKGTNAYIWSSKNGDCGMYEVYFGDEEEPRTVIDLWRNSTGGQQYLFPVSEEDLTYGEYTVTLVLKANTEEHGSGLVNYIGNIAVKGGVMDDVEFLEAPERFKVKVEYPDIVCNGMDGLGLKITGKDVTGAVDFTATEYDGKSVIKSIYNGNGESGLLASDGYKVGTFGAVVGEYYNYATIYMYVDDPEYKTAGIKPTILLREADDNEFSNNTFEADVAITPNAWQRISIDISKLEEDNPATTTPFNSVNQYHLRYLGESGKAKDYPNVTIYAEKLVFSAEDPGDWADLDAKVTSIKVNGESVEGFNINTYEYNVVLPFGTTEIPVVTADKNIEDAVVTIVQPEAVDGTATVTLEGEADEDDITYTINFSVFDGIKLNGFTAGDIEVEIEDGKTAYQVTLPTGTTEVPEIVADFEGDPAKITTTQATALDGEAKIELEDGTVYTITFYVIPSLEEIYEGAKIVYVSEAGAGEKNGTSADNAYATLKTALNAEAATEGKVVFAVVDDVNITNNGDLNSGKDIVITSVGGDIYASSHPSFKINGGANIVIENIDIYHTRATGGINDEIYLVAKGNDLTLRNVTAIPYGEKEGKPRTAKLYVQPGGDGGNFTKTENTKLVLENVAGVTVRGGGYGGSTFAGGIEYVVGGESSLDLLAGIQAAGSTNQKEVDKVPQFDEDGNPVTNQPEANRTVNGDITVTVQDDANIPALTTTNYGILKGDLTITVKDNATVGTINFNRSVNNKKNQAGTADVLMAAGRLEGNGIVYLLGGTVDTITGSQGAKRALVVDLNNAQVPANVASINHTVTYTGNGTVTIEYADDGTASIKLASETAQWAEVTFADSTVKKYDMATDEEVVLSHDMAIAITEGTTAVVFNEGTGVTFKAYEADGAIADSTNTVTGLEGMAVPAPTAVEVKNEKFEFLGWALEGDETKTIVTDFGTFTENAVTYVAIFKEAPNVVFKALAADGAAEDFNVAGEPIYGTTGEPVAAPEAPAAKEHFTFKGWALEGTTDIVTDFGTFTDEKAVYVAIFEEDAKFTVTVIDGTETIATVTDYTGFTYTFEALAHTTTTRFRGYAATADATEATVFAGNSITVTADVTYYAVREEIQLEDAEYVFEGEYDYSEGKYVVEMYYVGPKANMTAFGLVFPEYYTNRVIKYSDELKTTGTNFKSEDNIYVDVVYPERGATFGDDMKTPVLVATITGDMTPELYAEQIAFKDVVELIVPYTASEQITGAFQGDSWQYIKNDEEFSLDVASRVYPIYFTNVVDDRDITITVEGVDAEITTEVTAPTEGKTLEAITFTAVTADGEEPALVSYYVDGVVMGELTADEDGITYTIPAEKVLGDVIIEFVYGEPILEVAITDIEAPVAQGTPDTEAEAADDVNFTIESVTWEPADAEFGFDTAYTVKVTVTADAEYAFTGKTVYTINGETATVVKVDRDTVELRFTYEPTVKELGTVSVTARLVRDENYKAYANFATISVLDENDTEVATWTETAEDTAVAAEFTLLAGTYTVKIEKNGYLTYTEEIEVVYNKETKVETGLVAGNLYDAGADDGVIDLLDFARLTSAFTQKDETRAEEALAAYRAKTDIDEDGYVTVYDLMYIKKNFGAKAE